MVLQNNKLKKESRIVTQEDIEITYEVGTYDKLFSLRLLGRLKADCEYCIDTENTKRLWAKPVITHIKYMKAIWKSFNKAEKPKWLKMKEIDTYYKKLKLIEEKESI